MADEKLEQIAKSANPLVFISHDTRDAELAEAFSNLLKSVSAGVLKSFRTSDRRGNQGIEYGVEWYPEIIKNIQGASDVVCLLTKRSVDRPWILFEAGMAKGKLDTPILGVALGIELKDASSGPFAQFQNCGGDEDSLTKLVFQLVNRIPNSEPDIDTIKFQVGKFRQAVAEILKRLDGTSTDGAAKSSVDVKEIENSSAKLFEEIKIMFQDLPSRIERASPPEGKRRKRRFHPGMLEEMIHFSKDPKTGIKMALSLYREKMPWIYDEGISLLGKLEASKTPATTKRVLHDFEELLMRSTRNPFVEEFLIQDQDEFVLLMELPRVILRNLEHFIL
ncbi:toll/interleukin-1 receptor domain-containing protein [Rhodoferax saidenbachensis]|uniref:TIR domain-containing protein n=1 Tax=Rhodoferax saidenbachensis TaxID=1484693 RepID=A0A1P8KDV3_9BURK|nr:toll/interleukin-1 receptor domain-containing protein [Rhodoferax saidenbachensis]APW44217.1 TIR domain-containing protein [Rhodoferax saidenbachensis]